jgi:hypothetical protein
MYVITIGGTDTARKMSMKRGTTAMIRVSPKKIPYGLQDWKFIINGKTILCTCKRLSDSFTIASDGEIVYRGSWKAFIGGKILMREFALQHVH